MEALRAVRDVDTNVHGLKKFRRLLKDGGAEFLRAFLVASPGFAELHRIWEHQHVVSHAPSRRSATTIVHFRIDVSAVTLHHLHRVSSAHAHAGPQCRRHHRASADGCGGALLRWRRCQDCAGPRHPCCKRHRLSAVVFCKHWATRLCLLINGAQQCRHDKRYGRLIGMQHHSPASYRPGHKQSSFGGLCANTLSEV